MTDPRITTLAKGLVNYSVACRKGDRVLIECFGKAPELAAALVREVLAAGGEPYIQLRDSVLQREQLLGISDEQMKHMAAHDTAFMATMQCYIGVRATDNANEMSDVPDNRMKAYSSLYQKPVHLETRVAKTRWVVLRYPNAAMAQLASTSTAAFEDFYFNVCNLDYAKMSAAMDPLVELMSMTDNVRIVSPGTDITFSIKGMSVIKCDGKANIPDGEVFTAPVKNSVNGVITYNAPSLHDGATFERVCLTFKDGKIVKADANLKEKLNKILDTDAGARYIGEFALGVNPYIHHPMKDTLFDEKIAGSLHFTPGAAYDDADNNNKSAIHWDLVLIQTPQYGGGEIYFDGVLVRKDGLFVLDALKGLNPENLG